MSKIEKSIDVNVPLRTAYNQWTQFEEFPMFMEGVEEVTQLDDSHLRWCAEVGGVEREWDAEITEQIPDERIAWRSTSGPEHSGQVTFQKLDDDETRIFLEMEFEPEGVVETVGDLIGLASLRVAGDLERFKEFVETRGVETGAWRGTISSEPEVTRATPSGSDWLDQANSPARKAPVKRRPSIKRGAKKSAASSKAAPKTTKKTAAAPKKAGTSKTKRAAPAKPKARAKKPTVAATSKKRTAATSKTRAGQAKAIVKAKRSVSAKTKTGSRAKPASKAGAKSTSRGKSTVKTAAKARATSKPALKKPVKKTSAVKSGVKSTKSKKTAAKKTAASRSQAKKR